MKNKIINIINRIQEKNERENLKINSIKENISLRDDLGFDSMDLAELTVNIEDEFGVDIFADEIIDTLGEVVNKIKEE